MIDPAFLLLAGLVSLIEPATGLSDLRAFPPHNVCVVMLAANLRAERVIDARLSIEFVHPEWWYEARCQVRQAQYVWGQLLQAHEGGWSEESRLCHLDNLRRALGWTDYYGGRLPPAYPFWAFPEVTDPVPGAHVSVAAWTTQ